MYVEEMLRESANRGASDIYILEGRPVTYKVRGALCAGSGHSLAASDTGEIIKELYRLSGGRDISLLQSGDDDFAVTIPGVSRFRVNAYIQSSTPAAVVRVIPVEIPDPDSINIPRDIMNLAGFTSGILLFTGVTGSGKSTTLACLIDRINSTRQSHIVTIEDPIEYKHRHKRSIISQRQVGDDTGSYLSAMRSAMRQAPDCLLLGEMRDYETISAAITAAETGCFVMSTLHTVGAACAIDRIIDIFPPNQQNQVRAQLSLTLQAVVSQQLVPTVEKKMHPAFEVMIANSAVRNLIREGKTFQLDNVIQTSASQGMRTMDMSLVELYRRRIITKESAMLYAANTQNVLTMLGGK